MPRFSGDQARQAVEQQGEDRLIGGARRQVDLDLLFQLDDASGNLIRRSRKVSNCMTRHSRALAASARRIDHNSQ